MADQAFGNLIIANALHFKVWCFQIRIRDDQNAGLVAILKITQLLTFFVQHVGGDRNRRLRLNFAGTLLHHFFFDQTQDRKRQRLDVSNMALAVTARANNR